MDWYKGFRIGDGIRTRKIFEEIVNIKTIFIDEW